MPRTKHISASLCSSAGCPICGSALFVASGPWIAHRTCCRHDQRRQFAARMLETLGAARATATRAAAPMNHGARALRPLRHPSLVRPVSVLLAIVAVARASPNHDELQGRVTVQTAWQRYAATGEAPQHRHTRDLGVCSNATVELNALTCLPGPGLCVGVLCSHVVEGRTACPLAHAKPALHLFVRPPKCATWSKARRACGCVFTTSSLPQETNSHCFLARSLATPSMRLQVMRGLTGSVVSTMGLNIASRWHRGGAAALLAFPDSLLKMHSSLLAGRCL